MPLSTCRPREAVNLLFYRAGVDVDEDGDRDAIVVELRSAVKESNISFYASVS